MLLLNHTERVAQNIFIIKNVSYFLGQFNDYIYMYMLKLGIIIPLYIVFM